MSYILIPSAKDNCVFLTCEGGMVFAEMADAWREVHESLAANQWRRVLVDATAMEKNPDMEDVFDLAKLFWRNFPKGGRIALVVRWDQSLFAKSLEIIVRNLGLHLTVFVSEEQAEAWVCENSHLPQIQEEFTKN